MESPLRAVLDRRGGVSAVANRSSARERPADLGLGVEVESPEFRAIYAFEMRARRSHGFVVRREQCIAQPKSDSKVWFDRSPSGFRSNVPSLQPATDEAALALPLVGGDIRFGSVLRFLAGIRSYRIEPASLREMQAPDAGDRLRPTGGNAASVLREISRESPDDWKTLQELLQSIVPGISSVSPRQQGNKLTFQFAHGPRDRGARGDDPSRRDRGDPGPAA